MQAKKYKSIMIDSILESILPEEQAKVDNRMLIAAKIADAVKAKSWKKKDFMNAMGQTNQSVITKWLSGTHNFTMDTLTDIGRVLGVDLLNLNQSIEHKVPTYHLYMKVNSEESCYEEIISKSELTREKTTVISIQSGAFNNHENAEA